MMATFSLEALLQVSDAHHTGLSEKLDGQEFKNQGFFPPLLSLHQE